VVAGLDARGFILGAVVAYELNVGFVPIRKKGKLPFTTVEETYELEYGSATVELHTDAVKPGDRVLLIDDLIATGGTMMAGKKLLEKLGAHVMEGAAIVDLPELGGSAKLRASWPAAVHAARFRRPLTPARGSGAQVTAMRRRLLTMRRLAMMAPSAIASASATLAGGWPARKNASG
jgi:adenine phosphoribosyltransferase